MPEGQFDEKGKKRTQGLKSSLALRVILISLCFLVFPIIVLSGVLYFHEYEKRKEGNFFALDLVAHQIEDIVTGFISQNETLAETLGFVITSSGKYSPKGKNSELNTLFQKLTKNEAVSDILYVQRDGKEYYCTIASDRSFLGKRFSDVLEHIDFSKEKYALFSHTFEKMDKETLITAHPVIENVRETPQGVLLVFLTPGLFKDRLEYAIRSTLPISTSILTDHGRVITSTRDDFLQKRFAIQGHAVDPKVFRQKASSPLIPLVPVETHRDEFRFSFDGDERMAVYLPLANSSYGILVEMSEDVNGVTIGPFLLKMLVLYFLIFVAGVVGTVFLSLRFSRPMRQLCEVMLHVGSGERKKRFEKDPLGFEINIVGAIFNDMLDAIDRHVEEIKKERGAKEALVHELQMGQTIQKSLLPTALPQVPSIEMAAGFISAKEVGGDYYDVLLREKEGRQEVLFSIADASGKGVSACLYSLSIRSMVRTAFMQGASLEEVIRETNSLFALDAESTSAFVTMWFGVFDVTTKELTYANCGHHPALLLTSQGTCTELHTPNIALGVVELSSVNVCTQRMDLGDRLLLFTDGIVEAHNKRNELFGEKRVKEIALQAQKTPQDAVSEMLRALHAFSDGADQHDDITLLSVFFQT